LGQFFQEILPIASTIGVCGVALLKGDEPERYGSTIMFVAWVSSTLLIWQRLGNVTLTNLLFGIDLVVLISLSALTWTYRRAWLVITTILQVLQIFSHIARDLGAKIDNLTYYYALTVSGYAQLLAILVGTVIAWRERAALASFGIVDQPGASAPASARSIRSSVLSTPKIATKDPNRGPWF